MKELSIWEIKSYTAGSHKGFAKRTEGKLAFAYSIFSVHLQGNTPQHYWLLAYVFLFGCKAPTVCDVWLGLASYNNKASTSKCACLNKQYELLMSAKGQALKHIKQSAKKIQTGAGDKTLHIPIGILVLLRNHPEG